MRPYLYDMGTPTMNTHARVVDVWALYLHVADCSRFSCSVFMWLWPRVPWGVKKQVMVIAGKLGGSA